MQDYNTVHATFCLERMLIIATFIVGVIFPSVGTASAFPNLVYHRLHEGEVQGDDGVTAVGGSGEEGHSVVAGFRVRDTVPFVAVDSIVNGDLRLNRCGDIIHPNTFEGGLATVAV